MPRAKLINLRTGEVRELRDGDSFSVENEFGRKKEVTINFAMKEMLGPWSVTFNDEIQMVFDGSFVPSVDCYRCLPFREISLGARKGTNELIGKVVAHRAAMIGLDRIYATQFEPDVGLASVYHDRPVFTVEFAGGKRTVDADECVEATKDQQIAYWRQRALSAKPVDEDS